MNELDQEVQRFRDSIYYLNWSIVFAVVSIICNLFVVVGLFRHNTYQMLISWGIGMANLEIAILLGKKSDKIIHRKKQ